VLIINLVKKLLFSISGLITYPFLALPAFAQTKVDPCESTNVIAKALCGLNSTNFGTVVTNVVVFIIVVAVIVALIYLLYGGMKWIMSRGDKTEVESARNHITAAIVGLIIVFLALFIISILLALFGLNVNQLELPKIAP
jgi:hypothetical protein